MSFKEGQSFAPCFLIVLVIENISKCVLRTSRARLDKNSVSPASNDKSMPTDPQANRNLFSDAEAKTNNRLFLLSEFSTNNWN